MGQIVFEILVCYTAVFGVITQRSSPLEERCVTTLKTAALQTTEILAQLCSNDSKQIFVNLTWV